MPGFYPSEQGDEALAQARTQWEQRNRFSSTATVPEALRDGPVERYGSTGGINPSSEQAGARWVDNSLQRPATTAAMELSRRVSEEAIPMGQSITGAEDAFAFLRQRLTDPSREVFGMIFLTQRHAVIAWEVLFQGTLTMASVHPREVLKAVLRHGAAAVVAAHTHCSGHVSPSPDDLRLTEELKTLLKQVDCRLLDHLVLSGPSFFSFAREGLLT